MEADAQEPELRQPEYLILVDEEVDLMHPVERVLKDIQGVLSAVFTLRDPQRIEEDFEVEPENLTATFEDGGLTIRGVLPPGVPFEGRMNFNADGDNVIGKISLATELEEPTCPEL